MVKKIAFAILSVLAVTLILAYSITDSYQDEVTLPIKEEAFFSNVASGKKPIFIMGSSQVLMNVTHVNEEIAKKELDYRVYDLAINSDNPSKRLKFMDSMISAKPELVIYGIGHRDFSNHPKLLQGVIVDVKTPQSILPDPKEIYSNEVFLENFNTDLNPKLFTLTILEKLISEEKKSSSSAWIEGLEKGMFPFVRFPENLLVSYSNEQVVEKNIKFEEVKAMAKIDPNELRKNSIAIKKIITKLKENDIRVVLYSAPYPQAFWDVVDSSDKQIAISTLQEISDEFDVPLYRLDEKYSHMDVWADYWHVTLLDEGLVYSDDIVEIILDEIPND
jgi:hypothetical protein